MGSTAPPGRSFAPSTPSMIWSMSGARGAGIEVASRGRRTGSTAQRRPSSAPATRRRAWSTSEASGAATKVAQPGRRTAWMAQRRWGGGGRGHRGKENGQPCKPNPHAHVIVELCEHSILSTPPAILAISKRVLLLLYYRLAHGVCFMVVSPLACLCLLRTPKWPNAVLSVQLDYLISAISLAARGSREMVSPCVSLARPTALLFGARMKAFRPLVFVAFQPTTPAPLPTAWTIGWITY